MLSTVQLDYESCRKTDKVNNVGSYGLLSTKFMPIELAEAEMPPQDMFRLRQISSQLACA